MTVTVQTADRVAIHQLIFEAKGGILTSAESETLEEYLTFSERLYIGTIHGKMCCVWGLIPPTLLSDSAYLWLFSTDDVEAYKFLFVRHSQRAIESMLEEWPTIVGYCEFGKPRSIRWLRWLGATFGEPEKGFVSFQIRRE
jgi:hypothetical protein